MSETLLSSAPGPVRGAPSLNKSDRATVGVVPASEHGRRRRLLHALEQAYPVRFEPREADVWRGLDGLIAFGDAAREAAVSAPMPRLVYRGEETAAGACRVIMADHPALARPLRAARLTDAYARAFEPLVINSGQVILATVNGAPAWTVLDDSAGRRHEVAVAPAELGPDDALRSRLAPNRSLALLALVQFVRDLTAGVNWELPPPRAAFVIDDPNLRKPRYGHIDYAQLLRSATAHHYHVAMAMVPLDGHRGPAHPTAVELFRAGRESLSLCIHGNDHNGPELGEPRSREEGLVPAAQALRRIAAFEHRTGLTVDRIMVPPHERLSEGALTALAACEYEAYCGARPYPWIGQSPDLKWLTRPTATNPLIGWGSSELMPGSFPWLMRMDFGHPREELVIRAFLGQPLIVYGHHDLGEHGPGPFEEVAAQINRLGDVRWASLASIARAAAEWRRDGDTLEVRLLGRRVAVDVPDDVRELRVDTSALAPSHRRPVVLRCAGRIIARSEAPGEVLIPIVEPCRVELGLEGAVDSRSIPAPRKRVTPLMRRIVSEWRDRSRRYPPASRG
jgi:hypothetical protein